MLTYLMPKCTEFFFLDLENKKLFNILCRAGSCIDGT